MLTLVSLWSLLMILDYCTRRNVVLKLMNLFTVLFLFQKLYDTRLMECMQRTITQYVRKPTITSSPLIAPNSSVLSCESTSTPLLPASLLAYESTPTPPPPTLPLPCEPTSTPSLPASQMPDFSTSTPSRALASLPPLYCVWIRRT